MVNKNRYEDRLAWSFLAGILLLFTGFVLDGTSRALTLLAALGVVSGAVAALLLRDRISTESADAAYQEHKETVTSRRKLSLRSVTAAICALSMILSIACPVSASEISADTEAESAIEETAAKSIEGINRDSIVDLPAYIREQVAVYIDTYHIAHDMSDGDLANVYFMLDSAQSLAAWNTLNELLALSEGLSEEEANALLAESNIILCMRFYNIIEQINNPALLDLTEPKTFTPSVNISVEVSGDSNDDAEYNDNDGTLTVTAKGTSGCNAAASTVTITVTNTSDQAAVISFKWVKENVTTLEINGSEQTGDTDTFSTQMDAKSGITITITTGADETPNILKLSNFTYEEAPSSSEVEFIFDSTLAAVTVDGESISDGDKKDIPLSGKTVSLISDAAFVAWVNEETHQILSTDKEFTLKPSTAMTVKAIFDTGNALFRISNTHLFETLTAATETAKSGQTIVLHNNGKLPAGEYTIPENVTLLIPFDANDTVQKDAFPDANLTQEYKKPTIYRTLTMESGCKLIINGAMSLSSTIHGANGGERGGGSPSVATSMVTMNENSEIVISDKASLYAYGFITGAGSVLAQKGSTVYECFQIEDFRGGTELKAMMVDYNYGKNGVFALSQYYVQNIEVPITFEAGAQEIGFTAFYMRVLISSKFVSSPVKFIGGESSMFQLIDGTVTKWYDGSTDQLKVSLDGAMSINSMSLDVGGTGVNSSAYELPLNSNLFVSINANSSVNVAQDIAMLPGSEMLISKDATLTLNSGYNVYVYDADQWGTYCGAGKKTFLPVQYAPGRDYTRSDSDLKDAVIEVNGTLDCSQGFIYTTSGGANIYSTGSGAAKINPGKQTATYQHIQGSNDTEIPITSAKLRNENGTYVETASATAATTYNHDHYTCEHGDSAQDGEWYMGEHEVEDEVKAPTCSKQGYTTHTCACGHSYTDTYVEATGLHTWVTDQDEVLPTYQAEGSTATKHCSVCNEIVEAEPIPKVVQLNAFAASAAEEVYLEMKFFLPEEMANGTITLTHTVTKNGNTTTDNESYNVADLTPDANGRYVITHGIASGEMTCPVIVSFQTEGGTVVNVRKGTEISEFASCAVTDYAELVLTKGDDRQKALITNLLTYGGYAQALFNVDASKPAYNLLSTHGVTKPNLDEVTASSISNVAAGSGPAIGIQKGTQEAFLDSAIYHRVYFTLDAGNTIDNFKFVLTYPVNKVEYTKELTPVFESGKDRYYVDIEDIPAAYLDYDYKIAVTNKNTSETYTVTTSVLAYLKALLNSETATTEQKNLAKAMYLYNQQANTFFGK